MRYNRDFKVRARIWYVPESTNKHSIERWAYVEKKADCLSEVSNLFAELIGLIAEQNTEIGLSRFMPIPFIKSLDWSLFNTAGNLFNSGKIDQLGIDDVPVSIMTPLSLSVDKALREYHKVRLSNDTV